MNNTILYSILLHTRNRVWDGVLEFPLARHPLACLDRGVKQP